jgi:hypothetical protein
MRRVGLKDNLPLSWLSRGVLSTEILEFGDGVRNVLGVRSEGSIYSAYFAVNSVTAETLHSSHNYLPNNFIFGMIVVMKHIFDLTVHTSSSVHSFDCYSRCSHW